MSGIIGSIRQQLAHGSAAVKIGAIVFFVLAIGLFIYRAVPVHPTAANDEVKDMVFLYKCSNPACGNVLEMKGSDAIKLRLAQIDANIKAGGFGYPTISLPCPKCSHQLLRAERLPSGEVRAMGGDNPPAESPELLFVKKPNP